jgi:hypothetical protein
VCGKRETSKVVRWWRRMCEHQDSDFRLRMSGTGTGRLTGRLGASWLGWYGGVDVVEHRIQRGYIEWREYLWSDQRGRSQLVVAVAVSQSQLGRRARTPGWSALRGGWTGRQRFW